MKKNLNMKKSATSDKQTKKNEVKLTYEEKKELKLRAQKKKMATATVPANKSRYYCSNTQLLDEMKKWRDSAENPEDRVISEEFGKMMMEIANRVLNRSEFRAYSKELKEDMVSAGLLKMIKGLKNYDFRFTNVFAYLTTACWNANLTVLKQHYKHVNIKKDMLTKLLIEMETIPGLNPTSSLAKAIKQYCDDCAETAGDD